MTKELMPKQLIAPFSMTEELQCLGYLIVPFSMTKELMPKQLIAPIV